MNPRSLKSVLVLLAQILGPFGQNWVFHKFGWVFTENGEFYMEWFHSVRDKNRDAWQEKRGRGWLISSSWLLSVWAWTLCPWISDGCCRHLLPQQDWHTRWWAFSRRRKRFKILKIGGYILGHTQWWAINEKRKKIQDCLDFVYLCDNFIILLCSVFGL